MRRSKEFPVIGITGGIGSGKSTVLEYLKDKGACVIQADQVAKELMEPGTAVFLQIVREFGEDILLPDGSLDRKKLSDIVFQDEDKLLKLNSLTHPAVKEAIREKSDREKYSRPVFVEAALLIEEHYEEICCCFWYIYTKEEIRRARLKASRGYTDEKISDILRNQLSDQMFKSRCQETVDNNGTETMTHRQIDRLLAAYMTGSGKTGE